MEKYRGTAERNPKLYGDFIHSVFTRAIMEQQMLMENAGVGGQEMDPEIGILYRDISQFKDTEIPKAIELIQAVAREINGELAARGHSGGHMGKLDFRRTIRKALHPRRVQPVYMDGRAVSEEVCDNVNAYLAIYCVILVLSFAIISVDGFSIGTNFSAVASCFNNIGPGFELVGATQNFSIYSDLSKIILSLDMLLGRLEIFPLLLLLSPDTWSRRR